MRLLVQLRQMCFPPSQVRWLSLSCLVSGGRQISAGDQVQEAAAGGRQGKEREPASLFPPLPPPGWGLVEGRPPVKCALGAGRGQSGGEYPLYDQLCTLHGWRCHATWCKDEVQVDVPHAVGSGYTLS